MELMTELLEAGVHFGHQTKRWNPKMKPFIFEKRNSIYIINLSETVKQLQEATDFLANVARNGGKVLFIGCKKQAQEAVKEAAQACGQLYVNQRWLGGTLTNLTTIRKSVGRLSYLEQIEKSPLAQIPAFKNFQDVLLHDVDSVMISVPSAGLNPGVATLFIQSKVPEHAELHLLLSMITPLGWLERVPSYKDQQSQLADRDQPPLDGHSPPPRRAPSPAPPSRPSLGIPCAVHGTFRNYASPSF